MWLGAPTRAGKSSPVLTSQHVFLTGFEDQTLYTQCFDRASGKLFWERSQPLLHKKGVNQLNHPAAITPVTDGRNVYVEKIQAKIDRLREELREVAIAPRPSHRNRI